MVDVTKNRGALVGRGSLRCVVWRVARCCAVLMAWFDNLPVVGTRFGVVGFVGGEESLPQPNLDRGEFLFMNVGGPFSFEDVGQVGRKGVDVEEGLLILHAEAVLVKESLVLEVENMVLEFDSLQFLLPFDGVVGVVGGDTFLEFTGDVRWSMFQFWLQISTSSEVLRWL